LPAKLGKEKEMAGQIKLTDGTLLTTEDGVDFREVLRQGTSDARSADIRTADGEMYLVRRDHIVWVRHVEDGAGQVPLVEAV
jgi:hypothetical protein